MLDPGATAPRPVGVRTSDIQTLAANAQGVAWIGNGCVLFAPTGGAAPTEPPAGPCPRAEVALDAVDHTLHGRSVRMLATCIAAPASGCHGRATLHFHGVAGRAPSAPPPAPGRSSRSGCRSGRPGSSVSG